VVYLFYFDCRHCLWILGNAATLSRSGSIWENLVRNAKERQCFFNAKSDGAISRVIAKYGSELNSAKDRRDTPFKVIDNMVQVLISLDPFLYCLRAI
jgi:senataxin